MNMVFQKTRELGEALLQSEEYLKMKELEDRAMVNEKASIAMAKYIEAKQEIEELLIKDDPDPERLRALSAELDNCQEQLRMIDDVKELSEARDKFSGLIEQVNKVLKFIITGQTADEPEGCQGSCAGCKSSCGHGHIN